MPTPTPPKRRTGFALLAPAARSAVSAKGGAAVPSDRRAFALIPGLAKAAGSKGGKASAGSPKPGAGPHKDPTP